MYLPKKTYWYDQYGYTTVKEHMPESHLAYEHNRAQNAATLIDRAQRVGPFTWWAVENILQRTNFPPAGLRKVQWCAVVKNLWLRSSWVGSCLDEGRERQGRIQVACEHP